eukprot:scaffold214467_cov46-Prasinocladus_malaysianus.AAC.1
MSLRSYIICAGLLVPIHISIRPSTSTDGMQSRGAYLARMTRAETVSSTSRCKQACEEIFLQSAALRTKHCQALSL